MHTVVGALDHRTGIGGGNRVGSGGHGGAAVADHVVLTGGDVGALLGADVAIGHRVGVAEHRTVAAEDVPVGVLADDDPTVGGALAGLVPQGDVTEAEVEPPLLGIGTGVLAWAEQRGVVVAGQVGVVAAGQLGVVAAGQFGAGLRGERRRRGERGRRGIIERRGGSPDRVERRLRGGHRGRPEPILVGDRALQADDGITVAENHPGDRGGGHRGQLGGGHTGQAGIPHGLFRCGDERPGGVLAAEQVEDPVDQSEHVVFPFVGLLAGRSGKLQTTLWAAVPRRIGVYTHFR